MKQFDFQIDTFRKGYTGHIYKPDGSTIVEHYQLAEGTLTLQPDVREYFPDSESVNTALRSLIALTSKTPRQRKPLAGKRAA